MRKRSTKIKAKALEKKKKYIQDTSKYNDHACFINRELSWLEFNRRVLFEAENLENPILERLRFLSIVINNEDEFVMKRVGGLKRQLEANLNSLSADGLNAKEQLEKIRTKLLSDRDDFYKIAKQVFNQLSKDNIHFIDYRDVDVKQQRKLDIFFKKQVFPVLTPLLVDPAHPFPFISNLSYSLGVLIEHKKRLHFARVKIPTLLPFWIKFLDNGKVFFVNLESIVRANLNQLFPGMKIKAVSGFRVTRNADWDHDDDETQDLLEAIEEGIKERKFAECVRLEVEEKTNPFILQTLLGALELTEVDVYYLKRPLVFNRFNDVLDLNLPNLKYPVWEPVRVVDIKPRKDIFDILKSKDILVHHPYQSFNASIEYFIDRQAE